MLVALVNAVVGVLERLAEKYTSVEEAVSGLDARVVALEQRVP
jgi:hypothetical protein